jgi:hypothetical protein
MDGLLIKDGWMDGWMIHVLLMMDERLMNDRYFINEWLINE